MPTEAPPAAHANQSHDRCKQGCYLIKTLPKKPGKNKERFHVKSSRWNFKRITQKNRRARNDFTSSRNLALQLQQATACCVQGLGVFCEVQAHETIFRFGEETGARHRGDTDLARHPMRELHIARIAIARNVDHDVVGTLRTRIWQTGLIQIAEEYIPAFDIFLRKPSVIAVGKIESRNHGVLQRRCRTHGEKIMNLARLGDHPRRSMDVAEAPTGDRKSFTQRTA